MFSLLKNGIIIEMAPNREELEEIKNDDEIIIPSEKHHKKGLDTYNYVFPTTKELIENGEIVLEENQIFIEKFDYIATIAPTQKVVDGVIVEKTMLEKYNDGLITGEEYNEYVRESREREYREKTDSIKEELLESILTTLNEKGLLNDKQQKQLNLFLKEKNKIKNTYKKIKEGKK